MKKEILFGVPVIQTSIDPSLYDKTKIIKDIWIHLAQILQHKNKTTSSYQKISYKGS